MSASGKFPSRALLPRFSFGVCLWQCSTCLECDSLLKDKVDYCKRKNVSSAEPQFLRRTPRSVAEYPEERQSLSRRGDLLESILVSTSLVGNASVVVSPVLVLPPISPTVHPSRSFIPNMVVSDKLTINCILPMCK